MQNSLKIHEHETLTNVDHQGVDGGLGEKSQTENNSTNKDGKNGTRHVARESEILTLCGTLKSGGRRDGFDKSNFVIIAQICAIVQNKTTSLPAGMMPYVAAEAEDQTEGDYSNHQ